jgi:predicted SAM-dependent methyltransferase
VTKAKNQHFLAINLACGGKLCHKTGWINADHSPINKDIQKLNLLKPFPYPDNSFNVVYHAQFIEHLSLAKGLDFIRECFRVLKPNGIMRVVTPDLQGQVTVYLNNLQAIISSPKDKAAKLRYEWIRVEMLDQLNRHKSGGDMLKLLNSSGQELREYLWERMGRSGKNLFPSDSEITNKSKLMKSIKLLKRYVMRSIDYLTPELLRVGRFRLSGEVHLCMYDEYLLSDLLEKVGFSEIAKLSAMKSKIQNWNLTRLDCDSQDFPDGEVSLFMEAVKPADKNAYLEA